MWLPTRIFRTDFDDEDRLNKGNMISDTSKPKEMTVFLDVAI
jgi:hypothetical protein